MVETDSGPAVAIGFYEPRVTIVALSVAARLLFGAEPPTPGQLQKLLMQLWRGCVDHHPDFQAQFLIDYAVAAGLPHFRLDGRSKFWQYGGGARALVFFESSSSEDSHHGVQWSKNKLVSKAVLESIAVPTVRHRVVSEPTEFAHLAAQLAPPWVVKPVGGARSVGVTVGVDSAIDLDKALALAAGEGHAAVMVEQLVRGDAFRVLVVRGRVWKVIKREVATVVGDGYSSVKALVQAKNRLLAARQRPGGFEGPIPVDADFQATLARQGLTPQSVVAADTKIPVASIPLLSTGSEYTDVTTAAHPDTVRACEAVAATFGIALCGIDLISEDIAVSCHRQGAFLEVNGTPGLRAPLMAGVSREEIGRTVLGELPAAIPVILIVAAPADHGDIAALLDSAPNLAIALCANRSAAGAKSLPPLHRQFRRQQLVENVAQRIERTSALPQLRSSVGQVMQMLMA